MVCSVQNVHSQEAVFSPYNSAVLISCCSELVNEISFHLLVLGFSMYFLGFVPQVELANWEHCFSYCDKDLY